MKQKSRCDSIINIPEIDTQKNVQRDTTRKISIKTSKINLMKQYCMEYSANSNLHGLRYIGERERTTVEKIFWLFMFTCCVVLCSLVIRKVWLKWNDSPVIVSFAENSTPVWQIPFPAVTICSESKVNKKKFNITKDFFQTDLYKLPQKERDIFDAVSLLCEDRFYGTIKTETVKNVKKVSPNINDIFRKCYWQREKFVECSKYFSPILTEDGICYTFNILSAEKIFRMENLNTDYNYLEFINKTQSWSLENGYHANAPLETYPHRVIGYGTKAGMELLLSASKKEPFDYFCNGPTEGFKIMLHNPAELPRPINQYYRCPMSQEIIFAVKPKMITTSSELKPNNGYNPKIRQCYFATERPLKYFQEYTQANCELECLTNFTYAKCDCASFGVPHGPEMKICNSSGIYCAKEAEIELLTLKTEIENLKNTYANRGPSNKTFNVAAECKCLPACTSIEYEAETSQANYDLHGLFKAFDDDTFKDSVFTRIQIFFKEPQFITSRRSELYGQTDFLANCGGLLGLFMGFSILSIVEIIYFLTLRLFCLLWKCKEKKRPFLDDDPQSSIDKK